MSSTAEIRLLKVFASMASISGANAAKKRQKAATVFCQQPATRLPDAYSPKSAVYCYDRAHFVLYQQPEPGPQVSDILTTHQGMDANLTAEDRGLYMMAHLAGQRTRRTPTTLQS